MLGYCAHQVDDRRGYADGVDTTWKSMAAIPAPAAAAGAAAAAAVCARYSKVEAHVRPQGGHEARVQPWELRPRLQTLGR